jgi:16S rRNA (guanine527-N7)-methyltransferase
MLKAREFAIASEQIILALQPFGVHPSGQQIDMIREYTYLLIKWNRSISLTTIVDPREIVVRHFGECMFAACAIPVENCRLADFGAGAGFPGLALKIISPALKLMLIESNRKKCAFLSEVVRTLGLEAVEIVPSRFEEIKDRVDSIDLVTARALGGFPKLLRSAKNILAQGGRVILWVGLEHVNTISAIDTWIWEAAIKIPDSQRRYLLIGRPDRQK